jgi:hypothetical protein
MLDFITADRLVGLRLYGSLWNRQAVVQLLEFAALHWVLQKLRVKTDLTMEFATEVTTTTSLLPQPHPHCYPLALSTNWTTHFNSVVNIVCISQSPIYLIEELTPHCAFLSRCSMHADMDLGVQSICRCIPTTSYQTKKLTFHITLLCFAVQCMQIWI